MGVRIHLLAKELKTTSKKLIEILRSDGVEVASHLSSIDTDVADKLRRNWNGSASAKPAKKKTEKKTEKPAPKKKESGEAKPAKEASPPPKPAPKKGPIIARRGPILARPKNPTVPARGRSDSGPSTDSGPGGGGGGGGEGRGRRVRFFPGQSEYGGGGGGGGGGPMPHGGGRGRGRGGGGRGGGGRRGGGGGRRSEGHVGFQRKRDQLNPDRPSKVDIQLPITLKELSSAIGIKQPLLIKALLDEKMLTNVNTHVNDEMILIIGTRFDVEINTKEAEKLESTLDEIESLSDAEEEMVPRAPVVTFLGHVDHGKTSLLDKIRETKVTAGEAGGITQHLSAYRVEGKTPVVFIDTPGHKAFTEMRARGANVTDVVVLVVAADDGVKPQTEEAIHHARAAGVPIVVALNKCDREAANIPKTKQELATLDLAPPEWGGSTEMVPVSALTGDGIDDLLEVLGLETEILDLKANPNKPAKGSVLDSKNTSGRGIVTTALVLEGTLRPGDFVLCGPAWGRVRTMQTTSGIPLEEAGPSTPVEITGLNDLPGAGDRLYVLEAEKARAIAEERRQKLRESERAQRSHVTLETLLTSLEDEKTKEVNLILKADVKGSLEVVKKEVTELSTDEVGFKILLSGVGEISESDVLLADASDAIILGFHVGANDRAKSLADEKGVEIRQYQVIYQLIEDMKLALEGILEPELYEEARATVEIRQMYRSTKLGNIAGCMVTSGELRRENPVRLYRDGNLIHTGKLSSLKRFKEDVTKVKENFECGLRIEGFNDLQVGDVVESYAVLKRKRKLGETSK